ncbi:hypothetical protein HYFRA_00013938 [Hymenoscyphus fraxineus]|uniref:BRCT domain-containing protein n=1 Tax=Hymenoscyphus fraxineus TaxID=746836 RepID=A0A9N9LC28_9HELO|nr:hypothetical protein HYFRA_00013938 [Hymenoscyphus fraxineus]
MAPKKAAKASNEVHIVTIHTMVDSAFATLDAAQERLEILQIDGQTDVKITTRILKGGSVANAIEKEKEAAAAPKKAVAKPKAAKAKAMPESDDNDDEDAEVAPAAVAKQVTEKAVPPKGPLPANIQALLAGKGHVFDDMSIVITGDLRILPKDNAMMLVAQYGGKVLKTLSKRTSFVLVGENARPTKLRQIEERGIEIKYEAEFIALLEADHAGTKRGASDDEDGADEHGPAKRPKNFVWT